MIAHPSRPEMFFYELTRPAHTRINGDHPAVICWPYIEERLFCVYLRLMLD